MLDPNLPGDPTRRGRTEATDTTTEQVAAVLERVLQALPPAPPCHPEKQASIVWLGCTEPPPGSPARHELPAIWASDFAGAVRAYLIAKNRVEVLKGTVARINTRIDAARRGRGEGGGGAGTHPFVTARPWPQDVSAASVPTGDGRTRVSPVTYPPDRFWNAGKRTFGEWTSRAEKIRAFRHFAHLMHVQAAAGRLLERQPARGGSSRPMLLMQRPRPAPPSGVATRQSVAPAPAAVGCDAAALRIPPGCPRAPQ